MAFKASNIQIGGKQVTQPPSKPKTTDAFTSLSDIRAAAKPKVEQSVRNTPEVPVIADKHPLERKVARNINTDDTDTLINHHKSRYLTDMRN